MSFLDNAGVARLWAAIKKRFLGAKNANGYWGMATPDGSDATYLRTTSSGIIPYKSGGASSLGTSSWPFSAVHANSIYEGGTALSTKYAAKSHVHEGMSGTDYRPKDSIYITKGSGSPAALFGGTWAMRTDTYLFMGYRIWERVS